MSVSLTRTEVNVAQYLANIRALCSHLPSNYQLCAVLKGDAYGHSLKALAQAAVAGGAQRIGICDNWEIVAIRELGIGLPIVRLRNSILCEVEDCDGEAEEMIGSLENARQLSSYAVSHNKTLSVHLALNTGINRTEFNLSSERDDVLEALSLPGLHYVGVMTHFANADTDDGAVLLQTCTEFCDAVQSLGDRLPSSALVHFCNSAATLRLFKGDLNFSHPLLEGRRCMARVGVASYGLLPANNSSVPFFEGMAPVMKWVTQVILVRTIPPSSTVGYGSIHTTPAHNTRMATLGLGYCDSYPRVTSGTYNVCLIRGRRYRIVGRVSMNLVTVDISVAVDRCGEPLAEQPQDDIEVGDEVVLMGRQGSEEIMAEELAVAARTINYEITCSAGKAYEYSRRRIV